MFFVAGDGKVLARPQRQPPPPVVTVTKYYYFGGQRVAMRKNGAVTWLHSDHLGSASLATDASGMKVQNSEQRYTPFGTARLNASGLNSKFTYTGQRDFTDFGMMDYGARMYSPGLGRFLSADTIVPSFARPQSLNRYAYVENRPMNLVDPTGHEGEDPWWKPIQDALDYLVRCMTNPFCGGGLPTGVSVVQVNPLTTNVGEQVVVEPNQVFTKKAGKDDDEDKSGKDGGDSNIPGGPNGDGGRKPKDKPTQIDIGENIKKLPNNEMLPPSKRGNAPTSVKDGNPIEIHHTNQNPNGPFAEMHRYDHRGSGNDNINHPNKTKPSLIDRIKFANDKRNYWRNEWDSGRWGDLKK